ncbi:MAG: Rpp14/Pop5 family protein [Candidatus Kariarchaeaceae archaeon]|jgi:RNase P/RNase MRP subunit POP5
MVVKNERKRYLKLEFFGTPPDYGKLIYLLRKNVRKLAGEVFLARSSVHLIDISDQEAIIRCTHTARDVVEAAIQLFKEDSFIPVVRKVSGTIKALGSHLVDDDDDRDIETSNDHNR